MEREARSAVISQLLTCKNALTSVSGRLPLPKSDCPRSVMWNQW